MPLKEIIEKNKKAEELKNNPLLGLFDVFKDTNNFLKEIKDFLAREPAKVEPPVVNVPAPIVNIEAPIINIPEQKAPIVNIPAPIVTVEAPIVKIPKQDAPVVHINTEELTKEATNTNKTLKEILDKISEEKELDFEKVMLVDENGKPIDLLRTYATNSFVGGRGYDTVWIKNVAGTKQNVATSENQDTANATLADLLTSSNALASAIDVVLTATAYDLNAAAYSAAATISSDCIFNEIEFKFTTALSKTITVTSSLGTVLFTYTTTATSFVIEREDLVGGINSGENITVAVTQTAGACAMTLSATVERGSNNLLGNPEIDNIDVLLSTRTKPADNQNIKFGDTASVDAFGRARTADPFGIFDNKQIHTRGTGDWSERLWGCIIVHGTVTGAGFSVGEVITGGTSGEKGTVTAVNAGSIVYSTMNGNDFTDGETITGGTSASTAVITTHNTGTDLVYNYDRSSTYLKVGTANGDRAVRQTVRYFPYVPGKGQYIIATGILGAGKTNVKQYVMYGDDLNGLGFCLNGTTMSIITRTATSGSAVDTLTAQSSWNLDKLDGTGTSGLTLDITKSQIFAIDFQWLGVGRVRFGIDINGVMIYVHEMLNANNLSVIYMKTPTLPVRYEVINSGTSASTTTLEQVCSSVASEGGYALPGQEFSVSSSATGISRRAVTTRVPILAIRLKSAFPTGKPNRRSVRFLDFEVNTRTNDAHFELVHIHDPISITGTWVSNDSASGVEYSQDITAITGMMTHIVQIADVAAGQGNASAGTVINSEFVSNHSFLSQNFESDNSQVFVIFATSESGTANVRAHISFIEIE